MAAQKEFVPRTFSFKFKLIWSLASFGGALISGVYGALLVYFYQVYLGMASIWITLAATLYAVWNAINDPLIGFISDSTRGKKGRRIPFMRFTAPFLAITFIVVWLVPLNLSQTNMFWWMLITMLLYDTCYTIIFLMYSALLPEVTESDKERGELKKVASVFQLIGMISGFLLPDFLRPKIGDTSLTPLYIGVIAIGIFGAVSIFATTIYVKERPEFTQVDEPLGFVESIKYTFKSKAFLILTAANFMSILMQQTLISYMFYLADYVMQVATLYLLISVFGGLLLGTFFANILAQKLGVVQANQTLLLISGIFLCSLPILPQQGIYFILIFAGFGLSGPLVLTDILYAQVCDEDETKSGVRREASFFGTNALLTKPAQSVSIALGPFLLETAGFIAAQNNEIVLNQPANVVLTIKILVGLIPGICMLLGALILKWYPLRGKYLKNIQEKVLQMHAEKQAKLNEKTQPKSATEPPK